MRTTFQAAFAAGVLILSVGGSPVLAQSPQVATPAAPVAPAPPASPAQPRTAQQQRMGACNTGAGSQHLTGPDRRKFMSDCLAGRVPPTPVAAAAPAQSGTPAQQAQRNRMTTCNETAAARQLAGTERRTFMSTCLSGG